MIHQLKRGFDPDAIEGETRELVQWFEPTYDRLAKEQAAERKMPGGSKSKRCDHRLLLLPFLLVFNVLRTGFNAIRPYSLDMLFRVFLDACLSVVPGNKSGDECLFCG